MRTLVLIAFTACFAAAQPSGESVYKTHCSACHDTGAGRAPNRAALARMSPENVRFALTAGTMAMQGLSLGGAELAAVSEFVTGKTFAKVTFPKEAFCPSGTPAFDDPLHKPNWNGWGAGADQQRFEPATMAQLSADQVPKLKLKWAFAFPGDTRAFAQPAVAGGRIFVGSAGRRLYSLDAKSGCIYWTFDTDSPVRTAISIGRIGDSWAVYFGDQHAYAYAVNAVTGKQIWKTQIDEHPAAIITGSPTLASGRLYVPASSYEEVTGARPDYECCKFRGSVSALDATSGEVIWKSYTIPESPVPTRKNKQGVQLYGPSGAGVWSSPTVDRKRRAIYVTTGDSYSEPAARTSDAFLAFNLNTGKLLWSRQMTPNDAFTVDCNSRSKTNCGEKGGPDFDFGSSPILVDLPNGRRALIAGQKSGMVHAVNPDQQGEVLWQVRIGKGSALGGIQWGSATDGKNIYVALSDVGFAPAPEGTPGARRSATGFTAYNPKAGGGLFALNPATGEQIWQTPNTGCKDQPGCSPAQSAAVTAIPGFVFSGSVDGHLRAYSTADGHVVWDFNTIREYETVNGVKGSGGSIDGPGPVIVGGMVYTNSGYGFIGGTPGNVLLAFAPE